MYTLIINLGLRSIRGILFDELGNKTGQEWLPVQTTLDGSRVEQDPTEWWDLAIRVTQTLLQKTHVGGTVRYVSITAPSSCLVVLDKDGEVLMPSLMVADKRSIGQAQEIQQNPTLSNILNNTNHLAEASFLWPKLMWIKENSPEIMDKANAFLNANDYLTYKLTGKLVTDPLNAEKFYYDPERDGYPKELMEYCALRTEMFPTVQPIGTDIGPILPDVIKQMGLNDGTRVVLATYDAICAFWGAGVSREGDACNVSGTSLSFRVLSKQPARKNEAGILSQYYEPHNYYVVGGSNNLEGGLLEWARHFLYGEDLINRGPEYIYALMQEEGKESSVGARGLTFIPYLIGERVPIWDSEARGVFFGIERYHRRPDFIRSILESTGYMALGLIRSIEESGIPVNNIRMSGGMARLPYVCRLRANVTGRPVHVLSEHETSAMGAFMVVSQATGSSEGIHDMAQIARVVETYQPDYEIHKQYLELHELFNDVYTSLTSTFRKRTALMQRLSLSEISIVENL